MLLKAEEVADLLRQWQRRQHSHRGGLDHAASAALRIGGNLPGTVQRPIAGFDQRLHAREGRAGLALGRGEIDDAAIAVDKGAESRDPRGRECDKPHSPFPPNRQSPNLRS